MKAKIKIGSHLLFSGGGVSNQWKNLTDRMIVNFKGKNTYVSFEQTENLLFILTTKGEVAIVFTGEVPKLEFDSFEKDQLVLKIVS